MVKKGWLERLPPGLFQLVPAERGPERVADTYPHRRGRPRRGVLLPLRRRLHISRLTEAFGASRLAARAARLVEGHARASPRVALFGA